MLPQTSSGGGSCLPSEHFGVGGLVEGIMAELPAWPEQDEPESESSSSWSALSREPQPAEPCKPAEPSEGRGSSSDWEDDFKLQPRVRVIFELPSGDMLEKTFATIPSYAELWLTVRERVPHGGYQLLLDEAALSNANAVGLLKGVVEAAVASSAAPAVQVSVFYPTPPISAVDAEEAVEDENEEQEGKPWKALEPPAEAPPGAAPRQQPQQPWGSLLPSPSVVGAAAAGGALCSALTWLLAQEAKDRDFAELGDELQEALQALNAQESAEISGIGEKIAVPHLREAVINQRNPLWLWPGTRGWIDQSIRFAQAREQQRSEETAQAVSRAQEEALEVVSGAIEKRRTRWGRSRL